jgi:chromosome segregation ATPase
MIEVKIENLNEQVSNLTQRVDDLQSLLDDAKTMVATLNQSFEKLTARVSTFEHKVKEELNEQIRVANEEIQRSRLVH